MNFISDAKRRCREPNCKGIWKIGNIVWRFKMLYDGEKIYRRLSSIYPEKTILYCGSQSNGDYYLLSGVLDEYLKCKNDNYIFVIPDNLIHLIRVLDSYKQVVFLNKKEFFSIVMYLHFDKSTKINAKDVSPWIFFDKNECFINRPKFNFPTLNELPQNELEVINIKKTVLISPYEQTVSVKNESVLPGKFWEDIAEAYKKLGYMVLTNCKNTVSEPPIKGTFACYPSFSGIHLFVEKCGTFVGMRSGLTDIIAMTKAKKIILYPSERFRNYYSLVNMFGNEYQIEEYIISQDWKSTLNEILKSIKETCDD